MTSGILARRNSMKRLGANSKARLARITKQAYCCQCLATNYCSTACHSNPRRRKKVLRGCFLAAGIASIHFSPKVTQASLAKFVRGFPTGTGAKPAQLVEQLKAALEGDPHIHVNEVCFVPADSSIAKSSVAAHITARTLGMDSAAANELFNDPEKLLQLIVAAEGTKGPGGRGTGSGGQWQRRWVGKRFGRLGRRQRWRDRLWRMDGQRRWVGKWFGRLGRRKRWQRRSRYG